ncbi:hypothetical protein [Streptacidiphilus sp. P02-A3a]|uniref:hypothetical protein n=1 Tax=Streptacidiphilus sp. P02-A3a TaxID=2704468 RepID=UPI0015FB64CC|nr:hypothetical protein [Streptacidiphilus sp. P02-A3a]QMU67415.1 hypothetical protein GXP74_03470 [Streptacidiphilus sp. P02-A3a]
MATKKITVTVPEELVASIRGRVKDREFSAYITQALQRQDELDRLRELGDRLEAEHGVMTEADWDDAHARVAAIDARHEAHRSTDAA